jgi:sugar lactone lactonase YvrE
VAHVISSVRPGWVVPGARVTVEGTHLPVPADGPPHVLVGVLDAHVVGASHRALRIRVPAEAEGGTTAIRIDELPGESAFVEVARPLTTGIHQVDSPAFDQAGRLWVTHSGSRGTKAPVPLYRIGPDGVRQAVPIDISNPTSLALGPDGAMYISSRFEGSVYRVAPDDQVEVYATELGVPTGLAFAADGSLFVGDRSGTILRIAPDRSVEPYASLPASVAAFHLAVGPDNCLYVAAPTLATHDAIYRITEDRLVDVVTDRLGRPQGLAFDLTGTLYVVDALAGSSGLFRVEGGGPQAGVELAVSAPSLVGIAFDPAGGAVLASNDTVWRLDVPLKPWALSST